MNKNNKELIGLFKSSVSEVCELIGVSEHELKRDIYIQTAIEHGIKRLNKVQLNALGGFAAARDLFFPMSKKSKAEIDQEIRVLLESKYVSYIEQCGITPTLNTVKSWGYTSHDVNRLFGGLKSLYAHCSKAHPAIFDSLVNDTLFTHEAFNKLKSEIKKHKRFIITTAVSGKEVSEPFLRSLQTYENIENAMILIQPCEDVASRQSIFSYELDRRLRECGLVFKELYLNDKFLLSPIKVSAKQINPLTGLNRMVQKKGSMSLASPKQYLKFVANSNVKMPRALMTTGAVTVPDYSTDLSMSQRTSYIAEFDHTMGAIIIEIENNKIFHFRQVQADDDGSFIDLGYKYKPDGTCEEIKESIAVFGDTHVGSHCLQVDECLQEIVDYTLSKEIIVHDLFDNRFNNHHDVHYPILRAMIAKAGKSSLMREGAITAQWLNEWSDRVKKITIVKSNHDEALERYIKEGRWMHDPENLYDSLDLVKHYMQGGDPLKFLIEHEVGLNNPSKVNWLIRDEDYICYGIENGAHGDKGGNGAKGSLISVEQAYYKATIGHSHTAGILRQVYQVGTSTIMKLGYNSGASSWTNTMCIQYPNGSRQLINIIKKKDGTASWRLAA